MNRFHPQKAMDDAQYLVASTTIQANIPERYKGPIADGIVQYLFQRYSIEMLIGDDELVKRLKEYLSKARPELLKKIGSSQLDHPEIQRVIDDIVREETIAEIRQIPYQELVANAETREWVRKQLQVLLPDIDFSQTLSERGYQELFDRVIEEIINKEVNDE